jgi:hypothetical protein
MGGWHVCAAALFGGVILFGACRSNSTGKPGAQAPPDTASGPPGSGALCSFSGRFTSTQSDGKCPPIDQLSGMEPAYVTIGHNSPGYQGPLTRCPGFDPMSEGKGFRFRFRVDRIEEKSISVDNGRGTELVLQTSLHGANIDVDPPCGHLVVFSSAKERPTAQPGEVLQIAQRMFLRSDTDTPGSHVITNEKGQLLYSLTVGETVAQFASDFGDLLPELAVAPGPRTLCRADDVGITLASVSLSTSAGGACDIDSHSQRCCHLWGRSHEVQMLSALAPKKPGESVRLEFTIRDPGFFVTPK